MKKFAETLCQVTIGLFLFSTAKYSGVRPIQRANAVFVQNRMRCAMVKSRYIGDGHPTFNRNPYNGYINPYYWVDDHPLLYGNNGSLDPITNDDNMLPNIQNILDLLGIRKMAPTSPTRIASCR